MLSTCSRSYLLGFFFGDGSCSHVRGYHWCSTFYANQHDIGRLNANAKILGVTLNWANYGQSNWFGAVWPKRFWNVLELHRLQGYNGYTRRTSLLPSWVNLRSFTEGIWDADGEVRVTPKKKIYRVPDQRLRIELANEGLVSDIISILRLEGFDPKMSIRVPKGGRLAYTARLNSKDYDGFRQVYRLQPYKQAHLDQMKRTRK